MHASQGLPGGLERIRTAVHGFADRCLATRPRDLRAAKINKICPYIKTLISALRPLPAASKIHLNPMPRSHSLPALPGADLPC